MALIYSGKTKRIKDAIVKVEEIFSSKEFVLAVLSHGPFKFTEDSPMKLAEWMQWFVKHNDVVIKFYTAPANVLAKTTNSKSLFLNKKRLDRTMASIAGTLAHELCHVADNANKEMRFGHGNNSSKGKSDSFPYWVGAFVKDYIESRPK